MIRVFIAADSEIARAGLAAMLEGYSEIEVIGSGRTIAEAEEAEADVALWEGGVEEGEWSGQEGGNIRLVVLTEMPVAEALRLGAHGVLPRNSSAAQIAAAIVAAAANLIVFSAPSDGIAAFPGAPVRHLELQESLTARELDVLRLLAEGYGNKTIAFQLRISEHTVKFHLSSLYGKLGVSTRTEAVTAGARLGLLML